MLNRAWWAFAMCAVAVGLASAQVAGPISVQEMFRLPDYAAPESSRNGRYVAVRIPVNGRMNLAVIELETRTRVALTDYSDFDVIEVNWAGNDRLLYRLGRLDSPLGTGEFEGGGLFMISRDGRERVRLSETLRDTRQKNQTAYRDFSFVRTLPGNDLEVMVRANLRDSDSYDLYRMNITNGQTTLLTESRPARTFRFVLDRERNARVAISSVRDSMTDVVHFRRTATAPWEELLRYERDRPGMVYPMYFEADNRTLVIATNAGRDNVAVYRYDPIARKRLDLVFEHPTLDIGADASGGTRAAGSVFIDAVTDGVYGHTILGERPRTVWSQEDDRGRQRTVDRALPDTYNTIDRLRGNLSLVAARADRWPISWHLWDEGKGTIEDLMASRSWLLGNRLIEMRSFTLKTRDGLQIPSYYFLPPDHRAGGRLPTVVLVHGGPAVRADLWGSLSHGVREAQMLAARGYAVVLPNFRITPGFGNRIYYAGFGTFGRQMLDDHEDAARWAVAQGFADGDRICISGASYGGYATLMALARYPATFKCGVAGLVVSDLPLLLTSTNGDIPPSDRAVSFWKALIGVKTIGDIPRELSPINVADRIKQPVLMYAGADDVRTPLEQTTRMVEALKRAGNPPKAVIVKSGEGHGFGLPENNLELYEAVLKFFDEQIGPTRKR